MAYPRLKFRINQRLDLQTAIFFKKIKAGGINFKQNGILRPHPALKTGLLTDKVLTDYTARCYFRQLRKIKRSLMIISENWTKIAPIFFLLTKRIFSDYPWPKGKYICYLSIWDCNPIDPEEKTFQIYYKSNRPHEVIIHEMLHFILYDYLETRFLASARTTQQKKVWNLVEALTVMIMNLASFQNGLSLPRQKPYPNHKKLLHSLEKSWRKEPAIDNIIKRQVK